MSRAAIQRKNIERIFRTDPLPRLSRHAKLRNQYKQRGATIAAFTAAEWAAFVKRSHGYSVEEMA